MLAHKTVLHACPYAWVQVKNVTGRKLVGLRWWNEANDTGSAWRFESAPPVRACSIPACFLADNLTFSHNCWCHLASLWLSTECQQAVNNNLMGGGLIALCDYQPRMQGTRVIHDREKKLFWIGLYANMVVWVLLAFLALVRLKWGECA